MCILRFVASFPFKSTTDKSTIFRRVILAPIKEGGFKDFCPGTETHTQRGSSFQAILSLYRFRLVARDLRRSRSRSLSRDSPRSARARRVEGGSRSRPFGKQCARYFDARYFDSLSICAAPTRGLRGIRNTLTAPACIIDARALD